METETRTIPISSIRVSTRIRKDPGDLTELANDLQKHGLINPITVMDCQNGTYQLIAGLRRLEAAKLIQMSGLRATVLSPMQAEEMLEIEIAENEQRHNFTVMQGEVDIFQHAAGSAIGGAEGFGDAFQVNQCRLVHDLSSATAISQ